MALLFYFKFKRLIPHAIPIEKIFMSLFTHSKKMKANEKMLMSDIYLRYCAIYAIFSKNIFFI
ncbi:Uncharacterised protein [Providencia rustigianii]|uniref:Uncharacterized protein n=2 Tax=Providencia rustigianii TaxID=158850 RepID=D1P6L0_9GAMM|nr:hypothetical protein PROVRUST_07812 [Providencia rustigianii DSM 4541]SPY76579.1 Uncharacterised protein [Providencia rustigianii]SUC25800.1 Uncharacterised protein [Providencia rustigianii]SUC34537.1 Uncharacterised protein [Providencia rustigianii]VEB63890.1 Uncharacterised protein [Providencia rustigianii]